MLEPLLIAVTAFALAGPAQAPSYPTRPITLVVPFAPGGSASVAARSVADKIGELLGQQVVIDNRGGAGGTVATRAVAKAPPDGYTLLMTTSATVGTAPALFSHLGYDPRNDFATVGLIAATPNLISVHPTFPARTLAEWIKVGQEAREPIPYGSPGTGTLNHLTVELIAHRFKLKLAHVVYRGAGPALNDFLGGHIKVLISAVPNAHAHVLAGTMRALAITGSKRSPLLPEVPTFAEAGLPAFEIPLRWGIAVPAGTPRPVIDKLNQALNAALAGEDVKKRLAIEGAEPTPSSPEDYAAMIDREVSMWTELVQAAGIKAE
jgi:tripartite-type tricarboxylate transporter receptor subunit TctC